MSRRPQRIEEEVMKFAYRWTALLALGACLALSGCNKGTSTAAAEEDTGPAKVEHMEGDEPAKVTLTEDAIKRLDIQTAEVRQMEVDGALRVVIPYAAVLYDTGGDTWTYTNPSAGVYVRTHISIDRIDGDQAVLVKGPALGTAVVIVGGAELFGSETEVEEE